MPVLHSVCSQHKQLDIYLESNIVLDTFEFQINKNRTDLQIKNKTFAKEFKKITHILAVKVGPH